MDEIVELSCVQPTGACRVISYNIDGSNQIIILENAVLEHFYRYQQRTTKHREAGGQIFACFKGNVIQVKRVTGPRFSDRRSRTSFVPNRRAERREIKKFFKSSLHYIGDWHTHPEPIPRPSCTDIKSFQEMFRESKHNLASFLMIIVGTLPAPEGLFIAICNSAESYELTTVLKDKSA